MKRLYKSQSKLYSIVVMCLCLCKMHVEAVHGYALNPWATAKSVILKYFTVKKFLSDIPRGENILFHMKISNGEFFSNHGI